MRYREATESELVESAVAYVACAKCGAEEKVPVYGGSPEVPRTWGRLHVLDNFPRDGYRRPEPRAVFCPTCTFAITRGPF